MPFFCPYCCNILLIEGADGGEQWFCQTCPYICKIKARISNPLHLEKKKADDYVQGDNAAFMVTVPVTCPKCGHDKAQFIEMQIRSADEPMTQFFKCAKCKHDWKEN